MKIIFIMLAWTNEGDASGCTFMCILLLAFQKHFQQDAECCSSTSTIFWPPPNTHLSLTKHDTMTQATMMTFSSDKFSHEHYNFGGTLTSYNQRLFSFLNEDQHNITTNNNVLYLSPWKTCLDRLGKNPSTVSLKVKLLSLEIIRENEDCGALI